MTPLTTPPMLWGGGVGCIGLAWRGGPRGIDIGGIRGGRAIAADIGLGADDITVGRLWAICMTPTRTPVLSCFVFLAAMAASYMHIRIDKVWSAACFCYLVIYQKLIRMDNKCSKSMVIEACKMASLQEISRTHRRDSSMPSTLKSKSLVRCMNMVGGEGDNLDSTWSW